MKKFFLPFFLILAVQLLTAGMLENSDSRTLYLAPKTECGIFQNRYGEWSTLPAKVFLSYTDTSLIVEAELTAPPGRNIKAAGTKDDDLSIFQGETFEFQIAPAGQNGIYYHFIYSPSGFLYSARKRDTRWNPEGLKKSSRLNRNKWLLRLEIPFQDLNTIRPEKGEIWRINLARNAVLGGFQEHTSHSGAANYHNLQEFSRVIFGLASPGKILLRSILPLQEKNTLIFSGEFPEKISLEYQTDFMAAPKILSGLKADGQILEIPLTLPRGSVPMKSSTGLRLRLRDQKTGQALCSDEGRIATGISSHLLLDRYYYLPADRSLKYRCNLGEDLTLTLCRQDRVLLHKKHISGRGQLLFTDFTSDSSSLAGRYVLTLETDRRRMSRIFFILPKMPVPGALPADAALSITARPMTGFTSSFPFARKMLRFGERPYYLFCLSPSYPAKSFLSYPDSSNFSYSGFGNIRKNSPALHGPPSGKIIYRPQTARIFPPEEKYMADLAEYARRKNLPSGILRICYEAQIPNAVKTQKGDWQFQDTDSLMLRAYQVLKKTAPQMLCSIQTDRPEKNAALSRACDIFEVSFSSSSYAKNLFPNLQRDMNQIRREVSSDKPVIFWLGGTIPDQTCRTAEEIRYGVYLSILNGFSGNIIHMGHGFLPRRRSRLWSLLSGLHAEIESFYPKFALGKDCTGLLGKISDHFLCRAVRISPDEILMLAVNCTPLEQFLDLPPAISAEDFFTGEVIQDNDSRRKTLFTAYEPRIFLLHR